MRPRRVLVAVGCLAAIAMARSAPAQINSLLVSGQTDLATIDADDNGPDSDDCRFTGNVAGVTPGNPSFASLFIQGQQNNTPTLRACQLNFTGQGQKGSDSSSNYALANITGASGPAGSLPLIAELVDETANPDNGPVGVNDHLDYGRVAYSNQAGFGALCSLNGSPAAQLRLPSSPNLLVDLDFFGPTMNPTHLKIPGPPAMFELAAGGFQAFDAYIPLTANRHITVSTAGDPTTLLVDIDLLALPQCSSGAPTLTGFGLIVGALLLLTLGALGLSRREKFAQALSF